MLLTNINLVTYSLGVYVGGIVEMEPKLFISLFNDLIKKALILKLLKCLSPSVSACCYTASFEFDFICTNVWG